MKKIRCEEDLGIADCDLVAQGEIPGDIVAEVIEHLREEHGMDMPDAGAVVKGQVDEADVGEKVWTVSNRLREELDIGDGGAQPEETLGEEGPPGISPEPV